MSNILVLSSSLSGAGVSDELIAELTAADAIVIGSPMYNFGISATLKSWFDHVLRAGVTFHYTPEGPVGHLQGKRAIVVLTRRGFFSESSPLHDKDAQEPHIRAMLWFVGITDVSFIRAEKLVFGTDGIDDARTELTALAA